MSVSVAYFAGEQYELLNLDNSSGESQQNRQVASSPADTALDKILNKKKLRRLKRSMSKLGLKIRN